MRFISIDDHPTISDALRQAAEAYDDVQMVGAFRSIESVPKPARARGVVADVVILDLSLPGTGGMSGVETAAGWGLDVIVFSATAHDRVAREALQRGAKAFVGKSLPTAQVLDAVRRVAQGEVFIDGVESTIGPIVDLTAAEDQLLRLMATETRSATLAELTGVSPATVDNRISILYDKIGLDDDERSRSRLGAWARRNGYALPD